MHLLEQKVTWWVLGDRIFTGGPWEGKVCWGLGGGGGGEVTKDPAEGPRESNVC